jgi:uncharacterized membrane protein
MSGNKNEHVVMAFFSSRDAAEIAAAALKDWDHANKEVKLGAIGIVYKDEGEIKTQVPRNAGKGAVVGVVLGALAAALGPVALLGAAVTGGTLGGVIGAFFKKSFDLDEASVQEIGARLDAGKVGVVVAVDDFEMAPTAAQLANAGGSVYQFTVPAEALTQVVEDAPGYFVDGEESRRNNLDSAEMMGVGTLTPLT